MDKVLSIRNNQQIFSLFNKIQNYQQSLNRTRIINDAIKKALEERKKGTLNWRNIAAISFSLEDFDKRNSPEFIQLRVDLDDYNKIVEQIRVDFNLERNSPSSFVCKLILIYYLNFLELENTLAAENLDFKKNKLELSEFKSLPSVDSKLDAIYELLSKLL